MLGFSSRHGQRLLMGLLAGALAVLSPPLLADLGTPPVTPRDLYVLNCSGCHRENGAGMPPAIPDLRHSLPKLLTSPEGRAYVLGVPGVSRQVIAPQQIADILNWSRDHLPEQPVIAPDFTVAEILAARRQPLLDPFTVRRRLIPDETYALPSAARSVHETAQDAAP